MSLGLLGLTAMAVPWPSGYPSLSLAAGPASVLPQSAERAKYTLLRKFSGLLPTNSVHARYTFVAGTGAGSPAIVHVPDAAGKTARLGLSMNCPELPFAISVVPRYSIGLRARRGLFVPSAEIGNLF